MRNCSKTVMWQHAFQWACENHGSWFANDLAGHEAKLQGNKKAFVVWAYDAEQVWKSKKSILPYENRWPYCICILTLLTHSGSAFLWMWDSWRIWMRSPWKFRRLQAYAASIKTIYSQVWVLHWFPGGPNWNMESDTMENTVQTYKTKRNRNWLEMTWTHIKISNRNTKPIFKNHQEHQSYSLPNPSIHPTQSTQMKCGMAWDSTIFTEAFSLRMDIVRRYSQSMPSTNC